MCRCKESQHDTAARDRSIRPQHKRRRSTKDGAAHKNEAGMAWPWQWSAEEDSALTKAGAKEWQHENAARENAAQERSTKNPTKNAARLHE